MYMSCTEVYSEIIALSVKNFMALNIYLIAMIFQDVIAEQ